MRLLIVNRHLLTPQHSVTTMVTLQTSLQTQYLLEGKAESPVYALCLCLATTRINVNKVARKRLGTRKASFASAEVTKELTGMEIGGVTPVGLPDDLPIWIDNLVMEAPKVIIGAGSRCKDLFIARKSS